MSSQCLATRVPQKMTDTELATNKTMPHTFCVAPLVAVAATCNSYVNTHI